MVLTAAPLRGPSPAARMSRPRGLPREADDIIRPMAAYHSRIARPCLGLL